MHTLRERHPGFAGVAAALADWYLITAIGLLVVDGEMLSAGSYRILAEAVHVLTLGIGPDGVVAGMRKIGWLFLPIGVVLRASLAFATSPDLRVFRVAWVVGAVVMFTFAAGFLGAVVADESTGITAWFTYATLTRIMVVGISEPLENPARPNGMRHGDR